MMIIVNYEYTRYMGSCYPFLRVHVRPSGSSLAVNRIVALTAWQYRTEYKHVYGMCNVSTLVTQETLENPTVAGNSVKQVGQASHQA
jgi:hypothetical protein